MATTAKQARNSQFKKGSAVYECRVCGKFTRDTGGDNGDAQLCALCYDLAGEENSLSDTGEFYGSTAEVTRLMVALNQQCKKGETAASLFPTIADKLRGAKPAQPGPALDHALALTVVGEPETADTQAFKLLVTANPKRAGSAAHARFQGYFGAKTVGAALAAGVTRKDIQWDQKHGFIELL